MNEPEPLAALVARLRAQAKRYPVTWWSRVPLTEARRLLDAAEAVWRQAEADVRNAVNGACTCGGGGPGDCCPACDVWHAYRRAVSARAEASRG